MTDNQNYISPSDYKVILDICNNKIHSRNIVNVPEHVIEWLYPFSKYAVEKKINIEINNQIIKLHENLAKKLAKQLRTDGFVIIKSGMASRIQIEHDKVLNALLSGPEFVEGLKLDSTYDFTNKIKTYTKNMQLVGGGFAALGNPSSVHNTPVRDIRARCMLKVIPVLGELLKQEKLKGYNLEQLFDRVLLRTVNERATAEAWHKDESPSASPEDIIFGGWINLDVKQKQYFSCIKGTHRLLNGNPKKGFTKFSKEEIVELKNHRNKVRVVIEPGDILLFNQTITHEVVSKKASYNILRVFLGWRLTKDTTPLYGLSNLIETIEEQGMFPLKSDQQPPMYPSLWNCNWSERLAAWSLIFKSDILVKRKRAGVDFVSIPRVLKSLQQMGLPLYDDYSENEIAMYIPGREWIIKNRTIRL